MEIKRDIYLNKLISKRNNGLIKVVTGVRRCGKSYLLFTLFKNYLLSAGIDEQHIIEIAFDAFENRQFRDPDVLYPYLKEKIQGDDMYYVLLDEVPVSYTHLDVYKRQERIRLHLSGQQKQSGFLRPAQHHLWASYEKWQHVFRAYGI